MMMMIRGGTSGPARGALRALAVSSSQVFSLSSAASSSSASSFDAERMSRLLDHHNHDSRDALRELFAKESELYRPVYDASLEEERQMAYVRL